MFSRGVSGYGVGVRGILTRKSAVMLVYAAMLGATFFLFRAVPGGFVPAQDKQYLVGFAQLPDGATLDRTEEVIRRMSEITMKEPGVESAVAFPGLSIAGFRNSSNAGIVFSTLKPFEERKSPKLSAGAIAMSLNQKYGAIQDAFIAMFPPPPVQGLGVVGGFKLQIEDRAGRGYEALNDVTKAFMAKATAAPELIGQFYHLSGQRSADLCRRRSRPRRGSSACRSPLCSRRCRSISAPSM